MTAETYDGLRQKLGTLKEVAGLLGVHWITVQRRCKGTLKITEEAACAMLWLVRGGAGGRKRVTPKRRKAPNDQTQRPPASGSQEAEQPSPGGSLE